MRVPQFRNYAHLLQGLALIICGMIIGAAWFMSITHHQLDAALKHSRDLQTQLNKLLEDNESLKIYRNKQSIIKSVNVVIEDAPDKVLDDVIKNEIVEKVEEDLKQLKGKPISYIEQDPQQLREIYGDRIIPNIHNKDYIVSIHTILVIYGDLKIWISVQEYIRQPS